MKLDGVFLDMYGTLTTGDRAAVETTCAEIINDTGLTVTAHELSVVWGERFFHALDTCNDERFLNLYDIEATTLVDTMERLGTPVNPHPYIRRLSGYWQDPPLQPEVREFLAAFPLPFCIVSNADRAEIDAALRTLGIEPIDVVTSEEVRSYKPATKIFEEALRRTGWRREHVMHVGDSLHSDVDGARRAGILSGWVNRAHRIHDVGTATPDHEFADLLDLNRLILRAKVA